MRKKRSIKLGEIGFSAFFSDRKYESLLDLNIN